ncbi:MAG: deiodinase-like protein [Planctomycetaceae bacterium]
MQRPAFILAELALISVLGALVQIPLFAQQAPGAKGRGNRPGTKAGEVITAPDRSERWTNQLKIGSRAPEFTLQRLDKSEKRNAPEKPPLKTPQTVLLRELRAQRPVVLIFGSMTCPPFRGQLDGVDQVYEQFKDRVEFLFVYIREAHPDSVLSVVASDGRESLLKISQPTDLSARAASAAVCQRTLKLSMPIAVDDIDNRVGKAYAGWPNRMVVVDTDGTILYASDPAPGGTNAKRLRTWLEENLVRDGD